MSARGIVLLIGLLCVVLAVGRFAPSCDAARVTLTNDTARPLAWVALDHERGGERTDHLAPHATRTLRFRVRDEMPLRVRARFDDGAELSREGDFVGPRYSVRIAIRDTGIVTVTGQTGY